MRIRFINESSLTIMVGALGGYLMKIFNMSIYNEEITIGYVKTFLVFLLPPIIYESAFNIKQKEFYKNLGTICIYAVLGTLISIIFIGYFLWIFGGQGYYHAFNFKESLAYGAIISATDPVCILSAFKEYTTDPNFFLIVFGESIMNDAVSMVFYEAVVEANNSEHGVSLWHSSFSFFFILIISVIVGMAIGFLTSLFIKKLSDEKKESEKFEVGMLLFTPWVSYLITYIMGISSIVVLFFVGVAHSIYAAPFISKHSTEVVHHFYEEIAAVFEMTVFLFLGIGFFSGIPYQKINFSLVIILFILCLIGRFLNILVCSILSNIPRSEKTKIDFKKQFFLWFAGVRGAMAFALSVKSKLDFPEVGGIFIILTLLCTIFTLAYASVLLEPVLHCCNVIVHEGTPIEENTQPKDGFFENLKSKMSNLNQNILLPQLERKNENPQSAILLKDF